MGKTTRWFRSLLGYKKPPSESSPASANERKTKKSDKKRTDSAIGSSRHHNAPTSTNTVSGEEPPAYVVGLDANKHAIAVAAATAAVAEAALTAAHAAAEVVRLTSGTRSSASGRYVNSSAGADAAHRRRQVTAAIKIQSAFRAYLARRALKALKGLVKLQALVRGRIVRKQSADMLRRMQAMVRIQARACATRACSSESAHSVKSSHYRHPGNTTPSRHDLQQHSSSFKIDGQNPKMQRSGSRSNIINHNAGERTYSTSNWLDRWMEECTWNNQRENSFRYGVVDDEKNDKILEVDTWKPHEYLGRADKTFSSSQYFSAWNDSKRGGTTLETASRHSLNYQHPDRSLSSGEVSSLRSMRYPPEVDQVAAWNVENSPHIHSATSRPGGNTRRGAFSPSRSECARSYFGDYISYPNYMSNTESFRAKLRSQSAPRQRLVTGGRRYGLWDAETCSEKDSTAHFSYRSHGYSGSSNLDKLGTPIHETGDLGSTYGLRH